ncbi:MAG: S-layer protein domain-containing protein, partial [Candidatus Methanoperedens sp.]
MNNKITTIALAALMLLIVALPAGAVIQATSVEIRGTVASGTAPTMWDASSFAGFWYDLKNNLSSETLTETAPINVRDITDNTLFYNTTARTKLLKVVENGHNSTELFTAFPGGN